MEFRVESAQGHKVFVTPAEGAVAGAVEVEIVVRGFVPTGSVGAGLTIIGAGFDPVEAGPAPAGE